MERTVGNITIEVSQGDITRQKDVQAIVNAANAELKTGGGVAGAIHRAAGPELENETRELAPIRPGEAVITSAHRLPNAHIIHCLGPVYGKDTPSDKLLAACYEKALGLAEKHTLSSIAFPAISTGAFGYPMEEAAEVAFNTVIAWAKALESVKLVRFVLFSSSDYEVHAKKLEELTS